MRARVQPGGTLSGQVVVPGDKSISHRWLILAATARGPSRLAGIPPSLDVIATASCLAAVLPKARPSLEPWVKLWTERDASKGQGHGFTWHSSLLGGRVDALEVEGEGFGELESPAGELDCRNSGTTARLLLGVLAPAPVTATLTGDESLRGRPMERVAEPLRAMGARVTTTDGHAPVTLHGGPLRGVRWDVPVPSAQVKSAVLLAGLRAAGETVLVEPAPTRDHTERALAALGAPVVLGDRSVGVRAFQHEGLAGEVPGDVSSAAFVVAAAALTRSELSVVQLGLNPTRIHYLSVMRRMGIPWESSILEERLGEPVGTLRVRRCDSLRAITVPADQLPLMIDEIAVLAVLAAHASGRSRFEGAAELRMKESDRLEGIVDGIGRLGGYATAEGDDLIVEGGGLEGGTADGRGDHRIAMALMVGALGARRPSEIEGADAADVSFPGFVPTMAKLGAGIELA